MNKLFTLRITNALRSVTLEGAECEYIAEIEEPSLVPSTARRKYSNRSRHLGRFEFLKPLI